MSFPALQPKRILVSNYLDIKTVDLSFPRPGLYFVVGDYQDPEMGTISTGAGKTTLLDAMWWGLTGKFMQKGTGDRIVAGDVIGPAENRVHVEWGFEDEQGHQYGITRSRLASETVTKVTFFIDGEDHTAKSPKMTQQLIVETLGLDPDVMRYTHYLPQQHHKSGFLYDDGRTRGQTIARLWERKMFDRLPDFIERKIRPVRLKLQTKLDEARTLDGELEATERSIRNLKAEIEVAESYNAQQQKTKKRAKGDDPKELRDLVEEFETKLKLSRSKLDEAERARGIYHEAFQKENTDLSNLRHEQHNANQGFDQLMSSIEEAKVSLHDDAVCAMCEQPISTPQAKKVIKQRINHNIAVCRELQSKLKELKASIAAQEQQVDAHRRRLQNQDLELQSIKSGMRSQDDHLSGLRSRQAALTKEPTLMDVSGLQRSLEAQETSLAALRSEDMELAGEIDTLEEEARWADFWIQGCRKELRAWAFESVADELTQATQSELAPICGDLLRVKFDATAQKGETVEDKFSWLTEHRDKPDRWVSATRRSGGQKGALSLSVFLACRRHARLNFGLLMLDECLENLDVTWAQRAQRVIESFGQNSVVLFTTHNANFVPRDGRRILVHGSPKGIEVEMR